MLAKLFEMLTGKVAFLAAMWVFIQRELFLAQIRWGFLSPRWCFHYHFMRAIKNYKDKYDLPIILELTQTLLN